MLGLPDTHGDSVPSFLSQANMISTSTPRDFDAILAVINDAAKAYKGNIPADCWKDPYMAPIELLKELDAGVQFSVFTKGKNIVGVMGIQEVQDVTLIRHAYVATAFRSQRIGKKLLQHLVESTHRPVLMATWKAAVWAIEFYKRNGFTEVSEPQAGELLGRYWTLSPRQLPEFTVLADVRGLHYLKQAAKS